MNRLASTTLFGSKATECGRCGMEIHEWDGCCRDEVQIVKMQGDQHKTPVISYDIQSLETPVIIPSGFITASFENIDVSRHVHNHSPPLLSAQDTYLQINVFRI